MSYLQNTLLDNEHIIYQEHMHWIVFVPSLLYFMVANLFYWHWIPVDFNALIYGYTVMQWAGIVFACIALYQFIAAYIAYATSEYGVTNKRVLMKIGLIQRYSLELFLNKIEAIKIDQSILGRLLGYGTIIVIGTGGSNDPFYYIRNPLEFRRQVQEQIDHDQHATP